MAFANWPDFQEVDFQELRGANPDPSSFAFLQGDGAGSGTTYGLNTLFDVEDRGWAHDDANDLDISGELAIPANYQSSWDESFARLDSGHFNSTAMHPALNAVPYAGNCMTAIDPNLVGAAFAPTMCGGYNETAFGVPSDTGPTYGNETFPTAMLPNGSAAGPSSHLQGRSTLDHGLDPNVIQRSVLPQQALAVSMASFACPHPGCDKQFTRNPDMLRHAKVHDPNSARFDCSFAGCPRRGRQGFSRSDKRLAHERVHRRAIQRA